MALFPRTLQPSFIIRRKAMRQGLLGRSLFWKVVAGVVFGRSTLKKVFGRNAEPLGKRTISAGHTISVAASAPLSRRQAKRAGVTKDAIAARARADLEAVSSSS
jgi:hypothetical protein